MLNKHMNEIDRQKTVVRLYPKLPVAEMYLIEIN